jgi:hypothetical protein
MGTKLTRLTHKIAIQLHLVTAATFVVLTRTPIDIFTMAEEGLRAG